MSFTLIFLPISVKKSFAVEARSVGIYWDAGSTARVTSIDWGELAPGSQSKVKIFVKNEEIAVPCFLFFWTDNWTPSATPGLDRLIKLTWNYDGKRISPGNNVPITLTLQVSERIVGVTDFSFTIVVLGTEYAVGDVNHDGKVNMRDGCLMAIAYGSTVVSPNWNAEADFNVDNMVNVRDFYMFSQNFGLNS